MLSELLVMNSTTQALLLSVGMAGALYFVLVRPQLRRVSEHQAFIAGLKVGDRIVTGGGLIGQIIRCEEAIVTVSFGGSTTIDTVRATIHGYAPADPLVQLKV